MRPLSEWTKQQKINAIVLCLIAFVVLPLFTAIVLSLENPIKHSITEMTFRMGYRAPFIVWGICFIAFFLYTTVEIIRESGYKKGVRIFFYVFVALIEIAFVVTGSISDDPQRVGETVIKAHNYAAYVTFVGHLVLVGLMTIFSFWRNRLQGALNAVYAFFFYLCSAFTYVCVTESDTFTFLHGATALGEGTVFCLVAIFFALHYVGNLLFPAKAGVPTTEKEKKE